MSMRYISKAGLVPITESLGWTLCVCVCVCVCARARAWLHMCVCAHICVCVLGVEGGYSSVLAKLSPSSCSWHCTLPRLPSAPLDFGWHGQVEPPHCISALQCCTASAVVCYTESWQAEGNSIQLSLCCASFHPEMGPTKQKSLVLAVTPGLPGVRTLFQCCQQCWGSTDPPSGSLSHDPMGKAAVRGKPRPQSLTLTTGDQRKVRSTGNICLKYYFHLRNYFIYFSMQPSLLLIKVLCKCENCEWIISVKLQVIIIQSCPTICTIDYSLPGSSVHRDSPGKNSAAGVGCHALFQGIFPTQGSNLQLLYCGQFLYCLSQQGSPDIST